MPPLAELLPDGQAFLQERARRARFAAAKFGQRHMVDPIVRQRPGDAPAVANGAAQRQGLLVHRTRQVEVAFTDRYQAERVERARNAAAVVERPEERQRLAQEAARGAIAIVVVTHPPEVKEDPGNTAAMAVLAVQREALFQ